jgi:hypothetical protein
MKRSKIWQEIELELKYEKGKKGRTIEQQQQQVRAEAIQTAAMAIRFLENFKTTSNDECKIITETRTDS